MNATETETPAALAARLFREAKKENTIEAWKRAEKACGRIGDYHGMFICRRKITIGKE